MNTILILVNDITLIQSSESNGMHSFALPVFNLLCNSLYGSEEFGLQGSGVRGRAQ